jgi:phage terminase small subunit
MVNWDAIRKEYEAGGVTLKALAEKHDVKLGTLKSRKSRDGWGATKKDATKPKKVATIEPLMESTNLTDKQKLFCLHYIKYINATKAYQKVYGCSYETAVTAGPRLFRNVRVKAEIQQLMKERAEGVMLDATSVLQKYIDIAFADMTDFTTFGKREVPMVDEEGNVEMVMRNYVDFKESAEIDGTLITEIKQGKDGVSIKLADRMKAMEKLELHTDLLPDHFKRKIEEEKVALNREKLLIEKAKNSDDEEYEDDGFIAAIDGKEVNWHDEET